MGRSKDRERLRESRRYWDRAAASFDDQPDHAVRDPLVLQAWTRLLEAWLPAARVDVLDVGCGTGSLSVVLAQLGHRVTGIDISPSMIAIAQAKAASQGLQVEYQRMDAAFPAFPRRQFDAVICRHLLWALPEPAQVLARWAELLRPQGRLVLVEGYWGSGSGLHAGEISAMLPPSFRRVSVQDLSRQRDLWGKDVSDERYAIIADADA